MRISNLKAWMRQLDIPLGIVVNFHTTRLDPLILKALIPQSGHPLPLN